MPVTRPDVVMALGNGERSPDALGMERTGSTQTGVLH